MLRNKPAPFGTTLIETYVIAQPVKFRTSLRGNFIKESKSLYVGLMRISKTRLRKSYRNFLHNLYWQKVLKWNTKKQRNWFS
jgi:hypothetical protein